MQAWLGEDNAADVLTQSVPNNVTSEMGLALLDVADVIRPYPEVVAFLRSVSGDDFLADLPVVAGGHEARDALCAYLDHWIPAVVLDDVLNSSPTSAGSARATVAPL